MCHSNSYNEAEEKLNIYLNNTSEETRITNRNESLEHTTPVVFTILPIFIFNENT